MTFPLLASCSLPPPRCPENTSPRTSVSSSPTTPTLFPLEPVSVYPGITNFFDSFEPWTLCKQNENGRLKRFSNIFCQQFAFGWNCMIILRNWLFTSLNLLWLKYYNILVHNLKSDILIKCFFFRAEFHYLSFQLNPLALIRTQLCWHIIANVVEQACIKLNINCVSESFCKWFFHHFAKKVILFSPPKSDVKTCLQRNGHQ